MWYASKCGGPNFVSSARPPHSCLAPMFLMLRNCHLIAGYTLRSVSVAQFNVTPVRSQVCSEVCTEVWHTALTVNKTARSHDAGLHSRRFHLQENEWITQYSFATTYILHRRISRQNSPASVPHISNIKYKFEYKNQTRVQSFINVSVHHIMASQFASTLS